MPYLIQKLIQEKGLNLRLSIYYNYYFLISKILKNKKDFHFWNIFNERANCSLPCYIKKKGNTGMRTRKYWWVSRSLMTARNITLVLWVCTWKKTVANDRAGIKHLTLKFRGPVGLGGMNKWWKNELLKEHWPKSWMCSSHVVMVCYCCWNR